MPQSVESGHAARYDPFQLSFSTLISAFYETACEIIVENSARNPPASNVDLMHGFWPEACIKSTFGRRAQR